MKKIILFALPIMIFGSCVQEKSYDCECTYVPDTNWLPSGTPNKVENTNVKGRFREDADIECSFETKYANQHYTGSCYLK